MMSDLNMFHEKMSEFVSFPSFRFTLVIKLRNFDFESHRNTLIIFGEKRYRIRFNLNMSHGKVSDFALFPLLGFTLVLRRRNFDF